MRVNTYLVLDLPLLLTPGASYLYANSSRDTAKSSQHATKYASAEQQACTFHTTSACIN